MSQKTNTRSEANHEIDDDGCNSPGILGVFDVFEMESIVGEYCESKSTHSDSVSRGKKQETTSYTYTREKKKYEITSLSYNTLDLVSEIKYKKCITQEMQERTMKKLKRKKLNHEERIMFF
jgi:hypothetical protein